MTKKKATLAPDVPLAPVQSPEASVDMLAKALVTAINITKPREKVTTASRVPKTPWSPKNGEAKLKLKRKTFQHGIPIDPDYVTNEEIALLNQIKPGSYCDGWIKVIRRRDRGITIEYPVKTAAQRMRLSSSFGIRNLKELLERCLYEAANPRTRDEVDADGDLI